MEVDSRHDRDDDDDDDDGKDTPLSLAALEERRKEIQSRLRVATNALREAGAVTDGYESALFLTPSPPDYAPHTVHERFFRRHAEVISDALWQRLSAQRFSFDPPDRIRHTWHVNDLGREKCRALWELFDVDGDGQWSYIDFLEYRTALEQLLGERPEMHEISDSEEVWRMYTNDALETDEHQCLTFDGFLRYRESTEDTYPLLLDLQAMNISVEWRVVEKLRRVTELVREYFGRDDVLPFESVQLLLAEGGICATYHELWEAVQRQRLFHRCHRFVLAQKRALRLFGYKQKTAIQLTTVVLDEDPRVCRAGLLSLIYSAWKPIERTIWRRMFLHARLQSYVMLRTLKRRVESAFGWVRKAARTGLLRASCLQSTADRELGDYVFKVEVGSTFTTHSTINATYYSDADSAATLHELKYLERGAECFFYVDFLCRQGAREVDAQALGQKLTWFIELFLKAHLELLPFLFKWFITVPTKTQLRVSGGGGGSASTIGATPVIRFVVLFTGAMDLYEIMQSLKLPSSMQFDHFVQRLSMRWMLSHSIEEMLTNKRFVAGTQWACRGQLDARFNRQAWGQILRQCAMQMNDAITMEEKEREFMETQRRHHQQEQKAAKHRKAVAASSDTPNDSPQVRSDREWIDWLYRISTVIDSSKELSLSWSFRDLQSILHDNTWMKTVMTSSTFQRLQSLLSTAGGLVNDWKSLGDSFRAEFVTSRYVEAAVSTSAVPITSNGNSRGVSTRSGPPSSMEERLGASGSPSSVAASFPFAPPVSTPVSGSPQASAVSEESGTARKSVDPKIEESLEYELLELYDMCARTLQSVHAMRAEAGTSGVSVTLEGWNVFSILPRVVASVAGRRPAVVRTKSTMSNSSDGSVSAASTIGTSQFRPATQSYN